MVTAFAAGGLVDLVPALAVMLGANVGTTLIVQALSFDVSRVSFLFILIGVFMFRRSGLTRTRDLGRVGIGLGLMLIALQHLLTMITPFEDVPQQVVNVFGDLSYDGPCPPPNFSPECPPLRVHGVRSRPRARIVLLDKFSRHRGHTL